MRKESARRALPVALMGALLAPVALPGAADAQEDSRTVILRARVDGAGWLGLGVIPGPDGIVVTRVAEDGPAARAGLRPRDRIVRVDGRAADPGRFTEIASGLEPGRRMRLTVAGDDGRRRELVVVAAEHPRTSTVLLSSEMQAEVRSKLRALDSLRVTLGPGAVTGVLTLEQVRGAPHRLLDSLATHRFFSFETGEDHVVTLLRSGSEVEGSSGFFRFWNREEPPVERGEMRQVEVRVGGERAGPLLPHVEGQDRVGGARFTPLNEDLAPYFGVPRGLLVTELVDGTPLEVAGLRPGDVLVAVDGRDVRTIGAVRAALWSHGPGESVLTLVRRGRRVEVRLSR